MPSRDAEPRAPRVPRTALTAQIASIRRHERAPIGSSVSVQASPKEAELVALRIGEDDPSRVSLTDVNFTRP
jgi:hypothetical protein